MTRPAGREAVLAAALRANLRRRKAAGGAAAPPEPPSPDAPTPDAEPTEPPGR